MYIKILTYNLKKIEIFMSLFNDSNLISLIFTFEQCKHDNLVYFRSWIVMYKCCLILELN